MDTHLDECRKTHSTKLWLPRDVPVTIVHKYIAVKVPVPHVKMIRESPHSRPKHYSLHFPLISIFSFLKYFYYSSFDWCICEYCNAGNRKRSNWGWNKDRLENIRSVHSDNNNYISVYIMLTLIVKITRCYIIKGKDRIYKLHELLQPIKRHLTMTWISINENAIQVKTILQDGFHSPLYVFYFLN